MLLVLEGLIEGCSCPYLKVVRNFHPTEEITAVIKASLAHFWLISYCNYLFLGTSNSSFIHPILTAYLYMKSVCFYHLYFLREFAQNLANVCTRISQKMQDLIRLVDFLYPVIVNFYLVNSFFLVCRSFRLPSSPPTSSYPVMSIFYPLAKHLYQNFKSVRLS